MSKFTVDRIPLLRRDPEAAAAFYQRMFDADVIRGVQAPAPSV